MCRNDPGRRFFSRGRRRDWGRGREGEAVYLHSACNLTPLFGRPERRKKEKKRAAAFREAPNPPLFFLPVPRGKGKGGGAAAQRHPPLHLAGLTTRGRKKEKRKKRPRKDFCALILVPFADGRWHKRGGEKKKRQESQRTLSPDLLPITIYISLISNDESSLNTRGRRKGGRGGKGEGGGISSTTTRTG